MKRIFIKKCFLFTVGNVCRILRFITGSTNSLSDVQNSHTMPDQVRKWQRQQSKHFYAAGIDALVKRWDKYINVVGGYVEKQMFFSGFKYQMFYISYPFVTYLLTLPHNSVHFIFP
jgi:hypothetical protein